MWLKILEQADSDGDGQIDKEEFRKCMTDIMQEQVNSVRTNKLN